MRNVRNSIQIYPIGMLSFVKKGIYLGDVIHYQLYQNGGSVYDDNLNRLITMIKKFDEFINESLWKKAIERSKTGEVRLGDRISSNIDELKPVDLGSDFPFVFADVDLIIEDKDRFNLNQYEDYMSGLNFQGWRLPNYEDIKKVENGFKKLEYQTQEIHVKKIPHRKIWGTSEETGESLVFIIPIIHGEYYMLDDTQYSPDSKICDVWYVGESLNDSFGKFNTSTITYKKPIRLIKDKN